MDTDDAWKRWGENRGADANSSAGMQSARVERTHAGFTDHGGELGVTLYFTRCRADQRR